MSMFEKKNQDVIKPIKKECDCLSCVKKDLCKEPFKNDLTVLHFACFSHSKY